MVVSLPSLLSPGWSRLRRLVPNPVALSGFQLLRESEDQENHVKSALVGDLHRCLLITVSFNLMSLL